jgi:aminobenzoyl-glutamate transport protein
MLDLIERVGNRLPNAIMLFVWLSGIVILVSIVAAAAGLAGVHPGTGETVVAQNLLAADTVRRFLVEMPRTFTGFPPLGTVLTVMIGIGIAERTGLIAAALGGMVRRVPGPFLALALVFAGIMSSLAVDAGYVVLVPLGAAIFAAAGRHPVAGLAAAFAGVSGGFSANLLVTALDPLLGGISQVAAQILVPDYQVLATANWFLMIALVPAFSLAGAFVTARIIEPRLGRWEPVADAPVAPHAETPAERRALKATGLAALVLVLVLVVLTVPEGAVLRDPQTGSLEPFYQAIVAITMVALAGLGIVFGRAMGNIRTSEDAIAMASDAMAAMASYILLAFVAAHFLALFSWSNLGVLLAIGGGEALRASGLGGVPLLVAMILVSGFINLFIGSASAKWAILAPIFIPMFMAVGITPEATQAAYRIGDSVTNIVTPLLVYFPLILVAAQRYVPGLGIGSLIATMTPHAIAFLLAGMGVLIAFLLLEIPLGPGTSVSMPPVAPPAAAAG